MQDERKDAATRVREAIEAEDVAYAPVGEDAPGESLPSLQGETALAPQKPGLLARLPRFSDGGQKKAFGNLLRFFALVLVFTIIARGTSGATMPKVKLASPGRGELVERVSANATVEAAGQTPIKVPEGLTVGQMLVVPGQKVEAGTPLFTLNEAETEQQLQRARLKLQEMELNLRKLQRGEPYDSSALIGAQNTYNWAVEDQEKTRLDGEAKVEEARKALEAAKNNEAKPEADRNPELPSAADAQKSLEAAEKLAADNMQDAGRNIERARLSLESAQTEDAKARQSAADTKAQNAIDAEAMKLDMAAQQALIDEYALIGEGGTVYAQTAGTVLSAAEAGAATTKDGAVVSLSSAEEGFRAKALLPQKDAEKLAPGAMAEIQSGSGWFSEKTISGATLLSLSAPDDAGMVTALFRLPEGDWSQGKEITVNAVQSRKDYDLLVPISAVHQGQNEYFVYVMDNVSTVLGVENTVRKVVVEVLAKNNQQAAISGALSSGDRIVVDSSKSLAPGDKVREDGT